MGRWGGGEVGRRGGEEVGRWGGEEVGRWGGGVVGRWGGGEAGRREGGEAGRRPIFQIVKSEGPFWTLFFLKMIIFMPKKMPTSKKVYLFRKLVKNGKW